METRSQGFSPPSWRQTGKYIASADHVIFNPEKLGVIIEHFIRGEDFRREFKQIVSSQGIFPQDISSSHGPHNNSTTTSILKG